MYEHERQLLSAMYGPAVRELTDLVAACERAYNDFGKRSIFGADKGERAERLVGSAIVQAIFALRRHGVVPHPGDARASLLALTDAMRRAKAAFPNWPKAWHYWEERGARLTSESQ